MTNMSRRRYGGIEAVLLVLACHRRGVTRLGGTRFGWEGLGGTIKESICTAIVGDRGRQLALSGAWNPMDGGFSVSRNERRKVDCVLVDRIISSLWADIRLTTDTNAGTPIMYAWIQNS